MILTVDGANYIPDLNFFRWQRHLLLKDPTSALVQFSRSRWRYFKIENFSIFYDKNFLCEFHKNFTFVNFDVYTFSILIIFLWQRHLLLKDRT